MKTDKRLLVRKQIALANSMTMPELQAKFLELHGFDCGQTSPRNLRKRIAYRVQEIYFGGLSAADAEILDTIADNDPLANLEQVPARRLTKTPVTRFCRVWKGIMHELIAIGDGTFEYDGNRYKSLSAVARKITGTRWNGKLFFGVR